MGKFVGIGMGAIQAGLFLPRAEAAGLSRTVLVRRLEQADAINTAESLFVNVASQSALSATALTDIQALALKDDAALDALIEATEIAVAVSSTQDYGSFADLLAAAMVHKAQGKGPQCVIYTCENDLMAAQKLRQDILSAGGDAGVFEVLDTVIGKMSRTVRDQSEIHELGLAKSGMENGTAWLVEDFEKIYVAQPSPEFAPLIRLPQLEFRDSLQPYELAKLHGHNAAHAAIAFAGLLAGKPLIKDVLTLEEPRSTIWRAFVEETGGALSVRFGATDPAFRRPLWQSEGAALFERIGNPWLNDSCARVARDPERKLGWNDRLVGTIRFVEDCGIAATGWRFALHSAVEATATTDTRLRALWENAGASVSEVDRMLQKQHCLSEHYSAWRQGILSTR